MDTTKTVGHSLTTYGGGLTAEDRKALRAPFAPTAVKWVPIGGVTASGVMMQPHLNASLVFERLADVDPCWTHTTEPMLLGVNDADPFGLAHMAPWRCAMTLKGVVRHGIGQLGPSGRGASAKPPRADNMHLKTGYSDAIKRAALEFEVGAYLRAFDTVWLPRRDDGGAETFRTRTWDNKESFTGLNASGKRILRAHYEKVIGHQLFVDRYGVAVEYGDVAAGDEELDDGEVVPVADLPTEGGPDDNELAVLLALAAHNGRSTPDDVLAEALGSSTFAKVLPRVLNGVVAHLELTGEDAEKLRAQSIAVAGGTGLVTELVDALAAVAAQASAGEPEQGTMPV